MTATAAAGTLNPIMIMMMMMTVVMVIIIVVVVVVVVAAAAVVVVSVPTGLRAIGAALDLAERGSARRWSAATEHAAR